MKVRILRCFEVNRRSRLTIYRVNVNRSRLATLAGVIAQILLLPPGVPGWLRYGAVATSFLAFMLTRRSILAGVVCGEAAMLAGKWWLG